uniref:Uncharacterized protein n=1 Tax=Tetradesmus obliquus TaxID=3088 RepID=A0A383VUE4_TETOB|eukprot:jgi/Sobl393_1/13124/SZX68392.1
MVGVCCGCIAKPASVQPRKTYNTLVPQLFAGEPIATDEAIDSSMRRKIQKLQEYVQVNPAKIPKVSRRLMRRIKATLLRPGDNLGYVKVAVHAYIYLLARSTDEVSSYSPGFFAREVVSGPDAVVPLLLKDMHIEMRTLGAELLAVFTRVQSQVDCQLDAIQVHVPQVCRAAQAALSADRKEQRLQEAAERRRQGDKLAVPNPLDLMARRDPAHVAALEVACLRCLSELVALCRRSKVLPQHLSDIQAVMLENLRVRDRGPGSGSEVLQAPDTPTTPAASSAVGAGLVAAGSGCGSLSGSAAGGSTAGGAAVGPSVVDVAFYQALDIQGAVPSGSHPRQLAGQLLSLMGAFTRDIATVHNILDSFYEYLDERHRWQERGIVKDLLAMLNASGSQHQFPMYASLLRHASSRRLALQDCAVVLSLAAEKGAALDECYSLAALALALHEVPRAWAQQARRSPRAMPLQAFLDLLKVGPAKESHTLPAAAPDTPSALFLNGLDAPATPGTPRALAQNSIASSANGAAAAAAASDRAAEKGDAAAYKQQLAQLKEAMLGAVRLLACRVGTATELCEAVAGALAAAAAELGLAAPGAGGSAAAGGAAGAAGPFAGLLALVGSGAGVSASGAGAAGGAGSGAAEAAAAKQAADASEAAAAVMMLQCAAAATEAFVAQCSSSSSQAQPALVLPAGALPAGLVRAALPLLRAAPALVRRPVQRVLLALLPAAGKGLPSDKLSGQLAEATLADMKRLLHADSSSSSSAAAAELAAEPRQLEEGLAAVDALLRACLAGPQARPTAALLVGRMLLQQQALWADCGYHAAGGGCGVCGAHAALLLANSQMAALADATGSQELLQQQLPLDPCSCSALQLHPRGLLVTGAPADAAASEAAVAALEQQQPASLQQGQALRLALGQAPRLVAEYGEQLQQLLDEQLSTRRSAASSDGGRGDKPQLAEKVNALLVKRMSTLRRDIVHVSELMRDSISRIQDITPAASLGAAGSSRLSDPGLPPSPLSLSAAEGAGGSSSSAGAGVAAPASPAVAPASRLAIDPISGVGVGSSAADAAAAAALAGLELPSPVPASEGLTGVHGIAGLAETGPSASNSRAATPHQLHPQQQQQQQQHAVDADGIQLQLMKQQASSKQRGKLSAVVSEALQQPIPAGAFVVRDVKISRLAGELDM